MKEKERCEALLKQRIQDHYGYNPQIVSACANCAHFVSHFVLVREGTSVLLFPQIKGHCMLRQREDCDDSACDEADLCENYEEDCIKKKERKTFVIYDYLLDEVVVNRNMVSCIPMDAHIIKGLLTGKTAGTGAPSSAREIRTDASGTTHRPFSTKENGTLRVRIRRLKVKRGSKDAGNVAESGGVHK